MEEKKIIEDLPEAEVQQPAGRPKKNKSGAKRASAKKETKVACETATSDLPFLLRYLGETAVPLQKLPGSFGRLGKIFEEVSRGRSPTICTTIIRKAQRGAGGPVSLEREAARMNQELAELAVLREEKKTWVVHANTDIMLELMNNGRSRRAETHSVTTQGLLSPKPKSVTSAKASRGSRSRSGSTVERSYW